MKKLVLFAAVLMVSFFSLNNAKAQVNVSVNIGSQPLWGPTGYNHVDYYYIPDVDAYYYVPSSQYIYLVNGRWVWANALPARYNNFNLYNAYKVVLNSPKPYLQHNVHVTKYVNYKNYGGRQTVIRDSRDTRYAAVKGHPNYNVKQAPAVRPSREIQNVRTNNRVTKIEKSRADKNGNGRDNNRRH